MRTKGLRIVLASAIVSASVAATTTVEAQSAVKPVAKVPAKTASATRLGTKGESLSDTAQNAAFSKSEENQYYSTLMSLRKSLYSRSSWTALGDECNSGSLRVFNGDTLAKDQKNVQTMLDRMEEIVSLYGAGKNIDNTDGRDVARMIGEWEAGISRPKWDSNEAVARSAFAAGMTGEYSDPKGKGCVSAASANSDTLILWLPAFRDLTVRSTARIKAKTYNGADGMRHARDEFFRSYGADSNAVLEVIEVAPVVVWRDWAAVGVRRTLSDRGITVGQRGKGGVSYLMRRVQNEWRLVAVTRTWGG